MRSSLRRQLLHLATDLSALAANPEDLGHGFDLLTRSYATPVAEAARAALRRNPAIAPLTREHYRGAGPARRSCWGCLRKASATPTTPGCTSACATPTTSGMWCAAARPQRPRKRR